jgi:hypothetical protein
MIGLVKKIIEHNWKKKYQITVAIPTYNRLDNLLLVLNTLSLSEDTDFGVIILDNASEKINYNKLKKNVINYKFGLRLYSNSYKIGPDENIIRVTELSDDSGWVYLLGDSKLPVINIISILKQEISILSDDEKAILFSFDHIHSINYTVNSLNEFFDLKIKFGDFLLVGNSIINKSVFSLNYDNAYKLNLSRSVLPIFNLLNLSSGGSLRISKHKIIQNAIEKPKHYNPGLSLLECWYSFPMLCILPLKRNHRKKINKMILNNEKFKDYLIFIKYCLLKIFKEKKNISQELYLILKFRYLYCFFSIEKFFIIPLLIISKIKFINEKTN